MNQGTFPVRVIMAGGGTGGHVFPAIAIAEELVRRNRSNNVLFVGTSRGIEAETVPRAGFELYTIDVEGIKGRSVRHVVRSLLKLPAGLIASWLLMRRFRPHLVIGVGGYASGPAVLAAYARRVKTAIAEQNAVPGLTNRILGAFVDRCFVSFGETARWFAAAKVRVTGNPVRAAFVRDTGPRTRPGTSFTIFILGGSQGAAGINRAVIESLPFMEDIRDTVRIIHQTGVRDYDMVSRAYAVHGFDADVQPFIHDIEASYRAADLLVCRAGATTLAEITAIGRASLIIPFPHAAGDHQTLNANMLVEAGAAEMIPEKDLTGPRLADALKALVHDPVKVEHMEECARRKGNPRAAADIVDECFELIGA